MSEAPTPESAQPNCHVCGEPVAAENSALCNTCGQRFHLRLRNDAERKDCGEVWINEQYLSLEFACFSCLGRSNISSDEPPVGGSH